MYLGLGRQQVYPPGGPLHLPEYLSLPPKIQRAERGKRRHRKSVHVLEKMSPRRPQQRVPSAAMFLWGGWFEGPPGPVHGEDLLRQLVDRVSVCTHLFSLGTTMLSAAMDSTLANAGLRPRIFHT